MNIIVLGAGFCNKGNEAMFRVVEKELNQRIEGANIFTFLSPEESALAYASGVVPLNIQSQRIRRCFGTSLAVRASVFWFLLRTGSVKDLARSIVSFWDVHHTALPKMIDRFVGGLDAVVDIRGYAFGDPWSLHGIKAASAWVDFCTRKGKPYCFFPQSWGSFEKKGYAEETANMLQKASLFYARETLSQTELAKILKKPIEEIPIAPDVVLRFESGPLSLGKEMLRRIGIDQHDKPLVGITPNMRVYERTSGVGAGNKYVRLLSHLCEHCIERLGANVVLIPNEISPYGIVCQDDRFLCSLIASMVRQSEGCFAFRDYHSAEEICSVIACLDLLLGSRFHTLVFALSAGVPLVALGWAHKYDGLLRQFGLDDYSCHYRQFAEKSILELVDRAWEDRNSTTQAIRSTLPQIQSQVDAVFEKVVQVLCRKSS